MSGEPASAFRHCTSATDIPLTCVTAGAQAANSAATKGAKRLASIGKPPPSSVARCIEDADRARSDRGHSIDLKRAGEGLLAYDSVSNEQVPKSAAGLDGAEVGRGPTEGNPLVAALVDRAGRGRQRVG